MTLTPRRLDDVTWEIPAGARPGMRVPARIIADAELLAELEGDLSLEQLANVATLPGIVGFAVAMPDIHQGYGFPVGAVAATDPDDGVISPGGVGYDINCGVRLLAMDVSAEEIGGALGPLMDELARSVPSGTGRGGRLRLADGELERVLSDGAREVVRSLGLGEDDDLAHTESGGRLDGADPLRVSVRAKERGRDQLGTLGAGNHFLELGRVERVEDPVAAASFGLREGQVTALIHTGSRGLGHQVCTDYVRTMEPLLARWGIWLPDRQLACAPLSSPEGGAYLAAMAAAANFAWANRQVIAHRVRRAAERILARPGATLVRQVYDVAHNVAKMERHGGATVCVHRKGATRAFGPGRAQELPPALAAVGQPVFIPGSMGTASWVLRGDDGSDRRSFGSACHGAGRRLSRTQARRRVSGAELRRRLEGEGVMVRAASSRGLAEEAPFAYKDVDRVVDVVHAAGIARRVARIVPIGVVKG
jgi:tRNA-splicing ligase RtcB (3'-phosphate/5'-hydroxy nucleic acid ligase)